MSSMDICIHYSAEQKFDYQTRRDGIRIHDILIFSVENYMKPSSLIPVALTVVIGGVPEPRKMPNLCHGRIRLSKRNSIFTLNVFLNFPLDLIEIKTMYGFELFLPFCPDSNGF